MSQSDNGWEGFDSRMRDRHFCDPTVRLVSRESREAYKSALCKRIEERITTYTKEKEMEAVYAFQKVLEDIKSIEPSKD